MQNNWWLAQRQTLFLLVSVQVSILYAIESDTVECKYI